MQIKTIDDAERALENGKKIMVRYTGDSYFTAFETFQEFKTIDNEMRKNSPNQTSRGYYCVPIKTWLKDKEEEEICG